LDEREYTAEEIEELLKKLKYLENRDGILDHLTVAIESHMGEKFKMKGGRFLVRKSVRSPRKRHAGVSAENPRKPKAKIMLYETGATIFCDEIESAAEDHDQGERNPLLTKRILIGHELGHIVLHLAKDDLKRDNTKFEERMSGSPRKETEATYFAQKHIEGLSEMYNAPDFKERHAPSHETIKASIDRVDSNYKENKRKFLNKEV
jgi:hypothetical protein